MPWNEADRERHNIVRERYTSDLSDEEYAVIEPLLPQPKRRGRKPTPARTILNAIFYLARCACPWRYMPKDFPPYTTVQNRFYQLRDSGILTQIIRLLVQNAREQAGREAAPTGALRSRPFGGTLSMATIGYATNSFGTKIRAFARKLRVACGRLTPPDSLSGREGLTFQCPKARPKPQR
jgi:transposase